MPLIPALGQLRQEDLKASLGYRERHYLKKPKAGAIAPW
jgi:hypothetical protein